MTLLLLVGQLKRKRKPGWIRAQRVIAPGSSDDQPRATVFIITHQ